MTDKVREALEIAVDALADANDVLAQCKVHTELSIYENICNAYEKCTEALSATPIAAMRQTQKEDCK